MESLVWKRHLEQPASQANQPDWVIKKASRDKNLLRKQPSVSFKIRPISLSQKLLTVIKQKSAVALVFGLLTEIAIPYLIIICSCCCCFLESCIFVFSNKRNELSIKSSNVFSVLLLPIVHFFLQIENFFIMLIKSRTKHGIKH